MDEMGFDPTKESSQRQAISLLKFKDKDSYLRFVHQKIDVYADDKELARSNFEYLINNCSSQQELAEWLGLYTVNDFGVANRLELLTQEVLDFCKLELSVEEQHIVRMTAADFSQFCKLVLENRITSSHFITFKQFFSSEERLGILENDPKLIADLDISSLDPKFEKSYNTVTASNISFLRQTDQVTQSILLSEGTWIAQLHNLDSNALEVFNLVQKYAGEHYEQWLKRMSDVRFTSHSSEHIGEVLEQVSELFDGKVPLDSVLFLPENNTKFDQASLISLMNVDFLTLFTTAFGADLTRLFISKIRDFFYVSVAPNDDEVALQHQMIANVRFLSHFFGSDFDLLFNSEWFETNIKWLVEADPQRVKEACNGLQTLIGMDRLKNLLMNHFASSFFEHWDRFLRIDSKKIKIILDNSTDLSQFTALKRIIDLTNFNEKANNILNDISATVLAEVVKFGWMRDTLIFQDFSKLIRESSFDITYSLLENATTYQYAQREHFLNFITFTKKCITTWGEFSVQLFSSDDFFPFARMNLTALETNFSNISELSDQKKQHLLNFGLGFHAMKHEDQLDSLFNEVIPQLQKLQKIESLGDQMPKMLVDKVIEIVLEKQESAQPYVDKLLMRMNSESLSDADKQWFASLAVLSDGAILHGSDPSLKELSRFDHLRTIRKRFNHLIESNNDNKMHYFANMRNREVAANYDQYQNFNDKVLIHGRLNVFLEEHKFGLRAAEFVGFHSYVWETVTTTSINFMMIEPDELQTTFLDKYLNQEDQITVAFGSNQGNGGVTFVFDYGDVEAYSESSGSLVYEGRQHGEKHKLISVGVPMHLVSAAIVNPEAENWASVKNYFVTLPFYVPLININSGSRCFSEQEYDGNQ